MFTVKKVSNFSFFISLWIARGQRNCNTHLLSGVIPAEPQPTARGSLWICNTSTFQHRSFPFLLELFGYLVYLQLVKNNNNYLPGSCCLKALFLLDGITADWRNCSIQEHFCKKHWTCSTLFLWIGQLPSQKALASLQLLLPVTIISTRPPHWMAMVTVMACVTVLSAGWECFQSTKIIEN